MGVFRVVVSLPLTGTFLVDVIHGLKKKPSRMVGVNELSGFVGIRELLRGHLLWLSIGAGLPATG